MLKFVDGRTDQTAPPSHSSYYNRPVPALQLAASVSKFGNPTINKQDYDPNIFDDDIKPKQPIVTRPSTAVASLLAAPNSEIDTSDMNIQSKRKIDAKAARVTDGLIGGIESDDRWTTTTQDVNNNTINNNKHSRKKNFGSLDIISPITGQPVADYGNWRNDLTNKQSNNQSNQANNIQEQQLTGIEAIANKLRQQLASQGAKGIIGLGRKFRIMDDDGSNSLSLDEFTKGMKECKMNLSPQEVKDLFKYFDTSKQGVIRYDDFIDAIAGQMNPRRIKLVNMAFDVLDNDGNGFIEPIDIAKAYDASKHPDVISGKRTSAEVLREFLDGFDVGGEVDGKVTRQEFENYYKKISSSIDNDNYFELMIRNAWHISGGEGEAANTSNRRVLVTKADGSQAVQEITNDLGLRSDDKAGMMNRLKSQGIDASNIDLYGDAGDKSAQSNKPKPYIQSNRITTSTNRTQTSTNLRQTQSNQTIHSTNRPNNKDNIPEADAGVQFLISRLKQAMKSRGANGFIGLQRVFRIMDDDGSKSLNLAEFKKAMKEMKIDINETELRVLFNYFDGNHNDSIDFEEFIQGIREPLSKKRLQLVELAFNTIDTDGSGIVDAAEIASKYDASKHPDVLSGKKNAQTVLSEFLKTFDVGGEVDDKVTKQEFTNYYTNIGASIDNDNYFELMIRNAWHISGGEGEAANTSNRRVLVTKADGSQAVQEITNDLGLRSDDKAGMMNRLKSQGIDASNIDLYGDAGIREPLSSQRLQLVKQAFHQIDNDGNGYIDANEIIQQFDPSNHPEVLAGRKTPRVVLNEFLKTFDLGSEIDGKVTEEDFINYYTNVEGAIGQSNYATNNQTIELFNNDKSGMISRLQSQGIKSNSLDLFEGQDLLTRGKLDITSGILKDHRLKIYLQVI
eukprot:gene17555-23119_t